MSNAKRFRASERLNEVFEYIMSEEKKRTGETYFLKDIRERFFPTSSNDSIWRWKDTVGEKGYDRFPNSIMSKLMALREYGINVPDYFEYYEAPMLLGEEHTSYISTNEVKEIVSGLSDKLLLEKILDALKKLNDLQEENNRLLKLRRSPGNGQ